MLDYNDYFFDYITNNNTTFALTIKNKNMSQPYVIKIENTNATIERDLILFDAFKNLSAPNFGLPTGVLVSSKLSNVTYNQLLFQSMSMPFMSSMTYLTAETSSQVMQTFSIKTRDANGNMQSVPCSPTINPYQGQSKVLQANYDYLINGNTQYIISQMASGEILNLYIYPSQIADLSSFLG